MSKILLAGNDLRLLQTRAAVLAQTHASVICSYPAEARKLLDESSFDLIVLCHSLTEKEIAELTQLIHSKLPAAKILRIVSDLLPEIPTNGIDSCVIHSYDPSGLIRCTTELLQG